MKNLISLGIVMLMLAAGFTITFYDRADDGIKILNDDDFKDIDNYKLEQINTRIYFEGMPSTYEQYKQNALDNKVKDIANSNGVIIG